MIRRVCIVDAHTPFYCVATDRVREVRGLPHWQTVEIDGVIYATVDVAARLS